MPAVHRPQPAALPPSLRLGVPIVAAVLIVAGVASAMAIRPSRHGRPAGPGLTTTLPAGVTGPSATTALPAGVTGPAVTTTLPTDALAGASGAGASGSAPPSSLPDTR